MATTERGIFYTNAANDGDVADLNVITKAIADSTDAALDLLDGEKQDVGHATGNYVPLSAFASDGDPLLRRATVTLPELPPGTSHWAVSLGLATTSPGGNTQISFALSGRSLTLAIYNLDSWTMAGVHYTAVAY